ncbi:hypothetical protein FSP39_011477 [Pinctada imbricata]|uniref:Fibrinogen C-terminal domain-containing protein n=1 Tax=Pinctada imbricata TaxID=66713 RepID=A0AA88XWC3_PINIB|nr:hypothetical protein FSP39_011477 [Pinctada imbricata]
MISVYEGFRALLLVVGFAAGLHDRKTSYVADIAFSAWVALALYLFPQPIAAELGAAGNHMSEYLLRESGCWMVLPILMLYMNRRSRDETILGSLLWSRALTMWSAIFFYGCQWVFSVYQLAKTRPSLGRREVKGVVGVICRLNFLVLFLIGLMSMAFPKMLFENQSLTPKTIDLHLSRFLGALIFAMIIPAWYSASFRHNEDRKNFFSCQLLVMALLTGAQMHNFFWEKSFPTKDLVPWLIGDVIMLACPLVGLVIITKEEKDAEDNRTHYYFRTRKIDLKAEKARPNRENSHQNGCDPRNEQHSEFSFTFSYIHILIFLYVDLGDIFQPVKGCQFSSKDRDHDNADFSCAKKYGAGWWFERCHRGNVNGPFCSDCTDNEETSKFLSLKINDTYEHVKSIVIAIF